MLVNKEFMIDFLNNNISEKQIDYEEEGIIYINSFLYSNNTKNKLLIDLEKGSWWDFKELIGGQDFLSLMLKYYEVVEGVNKSKTDLMLELMRQNLISFDKKTNEKVEKSVIDLLPFYKSCQNLQKNHYDLLSLRHIDKKRAKFYGLKHIIYDDIPFIVIPFIHNMRLKDVQLWNYTKNEKYEKYHLMQTTKYLFGLQQKNEKNLYITEGVFDAMMVNGIATLGSSLTEKQMLILKKEKFEKIILIQDNDKNGDKSLSKNEEIIKQTLPEFSNKIYFYD